MNEVKKCPKCGSEMKPEDKIRLMAIRQQGLPRNGNPQVTRLSLSPALIVVT